MGLVAIFTHFICMWTRSGGCKIIGTGCVLGRAPRIKETLPDFMSGVGLPDVHEYFAG